MENSISGYHRGMNKHTLSSESQRIKNIEIFKDTAEMIKSNDYLSESVLLSSSNTGFYKPDDIFPIPRRRFGNTNIIISRKRSGEAARAYNGQNVAILNFASARNPGGGVLSGSNAQEESLCRISTLYPVLAYGENARRYYEYHKLISSSDYSDAMLYTPDVIFFKSDTSIPELLEKKLWYKASIITSAAPNLAAEKWESMDRMRQNEIKVLFLRRIKRILDIAYANGTEILILGAFGCGVFRNPPEMVANCFKTVLLEYDGVFKTIEFAVFALSENDRNYKTFITTFGKTPDI